MITHGSSYRLLREIDGLVEDHSDWLPTNDRLELVRDSVVHNLRMAHQRYAKHYNTRSRPTVFHPGEPVYRRNFVLSNTEKRFNAKLAPKFVPGRIERRIGSCYYDVVDLDTGSCSTYHAKDIRR